jgi:hypothetical protein
VFYHKERDISLVVHGDDFTFCGLKEDLLWIRVQMQKWYEIKVRAILGPNEEDDKEVVILGRLVVWTEEGIEYEADPKHRTKILEYFGFNDKTKPARTNGDKDDKVEKGDEVYLDKDEAKIFRGLAARLNFMSLDCPDLQFAIKQSSRDMAKPTVGSWKHLKKVARYLVGVKRVVWKFKYGGGIQHCGVWTDSDWGGTYKDRKSTSGGSGFY